MKDFRATPFKYQNHHFMFWFLKFDVFLTRRIFGPDESFEVDALCRIPPTYEYFTSKFRPESFMENEQTTMVFKIPHIFHVKIYSSVKRTSCP